jgi:hypothetical protein
MWKLKLNNFPKFDTPSKIEFLGIWENCSALQSCKSTDHGGCHIIIVIMDINLYCNIHPFASCSRILLRGLRCGTGILCTLNNRYLHEMKVSAGIQAANWRQMTIKFSRIFSTLSGFEKTSNYVTLEKYGLKAVLGFLIVLKYMKNKQAL